jgi:Flp pilus assembly protein TadD
MSYGAPDAVAWLAFGMLCIESGSFAAGREAFTRATALLPGSSQAWTGLGACRIKLGDAPGARDALQRAVRLDPANQRAALLLRALNAATGEGG